MKDQKACIYCKKLSFQGTIGEPFDPSIMTLCMQGVYLMIRNHESVGMEKTGKGHLLPDEWMRICTANAMISFT